MIKVLSYNIHKGFSSGNLKFTLHQIRETIRATRADIVFLQEVQGEHQKNLASISNWPTEAQFEFLADSVWPHFAYGKNAIYPHGHHGNAILSRFPIERWDNIDLSTNRLEDRGLLHTVLRIPRDFRAENQGTPVELTADSVRLHAFCSHLGLLESSRQTQAKWIAQRISEHAASENGLMSEPILLAGDFNDWRGRLSPFLLDAVGLREAFQTLQGTHAKTFPAWLPALTLDRIYFRGLKIKAAQSFEGEPWNSLSDHLALGAEFTL